MKKFIALVLVLVMVLSLSTVAFAYAGPDWGQSLAADTVNGVLSVFNHIFNKHHYTDLRFSDNNAYGSLANAVIDYHDGVVYGIADAIDEMADYIGGHFAPNFFSFRMHQGIACCVERMAEVFSYVYRIGGRF